MPDQTIKCQKCGAEIPLTEALTDQIEQSIRLQYETETASKEKDYQEKLIDIQKQTKELEKQKQSIEEQVAEQVKVERKSIAEQEKVKILAEQSEKTKALQEELEEKNKKISEANKGRILTDKTKNHLSKINSGQGNPNFGRPRNKEIKNE